MSYILPQVQVFQLFSQVPSTVIANLNAFTFGANYQLFRYAVAAEKALISLGAYDKDNDTEYAFPNLPASSTVDLSYVKLYLENVWAEYLNIPASPSNPLNSLSVAARNKLRAAPAIGDPENADTTHPSLGDDTKGFFTGDVALPEDYYFWPTGGWTGAAWAASGYTATISTGSGEDAMLAYQTSESLTGTMAVDNTDNPLTAGVGIEGPDGLQLDFDAGSVDNVLRAPITMRFEDAAGTSFFTVVVDPTELPTVIDWALDNSLPIQANVDLAAGANAVSWSSTTRTLIVTAVGGYTLLAIKTAMEADSDIATYFDISAITGTSGNAVADVLDEASVSLDTGVDVELVPTGYRIRMTSNPYVFKTGNGYTHSGQFKTRGVLVGDRVRYQVTDPNGIVRTGTTKVVGFEADETLATISDPTSKSTNGATQAATAFVPKTGQDIIDAGTDNQRAFDGSATKVYALDPTNAQYTGELVDGVISDAFTITISASGDAGVAQATVENDSGTYTRLNVPIEEGKVGDADRARIYLGRNLWALLEKGSGDADAEFQAGDVYAFSADADAGFTSLSATQITVDGEYTGLGDTTYMIEVIRGGAFNRTVATIDGLTAPNKMVITYTGQPMLADRVTVGAVAFEADTDFAIGIDADTTYANLVAAINANPIAVYAVQVLSAGTVTCTGPGSLINGSFLGTDLTDATDYTNATEVTDAIQLNAVVNVDDWTGGDADDEYILKCTTAGAITAAQFQLSSQGGDSDTVVQFTNWGTLATDAVAVGSRGLSLYFQDLMGTTPTFAIGDYWVVKLNMSRPQVRISDTAGIDNGSTEVVNDAIPIDIGGYGIELTFTTNTNTEGGFVTGGGLNKDDVYYVVAEASADGAYRTLVLADELPSQAEEGIDSAGDTNLNPSNFAVWLYMIQNAVQVASKRVQAPPDYNWLATDATGAAPDVTVYEDMQVTDTSWVNGDGTLAYMDVYAATMYCEYRALLTADSDTIHFISDIADVATTLGTIAPDNPLAQGVYNALSNSGNRGVYYMAVPSDDSTGFLEVLDRAGLSDDVYGFAPLTTNRSILNSVEAHIVAMSTETDKRWRIGFFGTKMETEVAVYDLAKNPASVPFYAVVEDDPNTTGTQYTLLKFTDADGDPSLYTECLDDVVAGDAIRINYSTDAWGTATYAEVEVATILSNTSVLLETGLSAPIVVPAKVEVWHDYTVAQMAERVAAVSAGYANRRIYHVFPSQLGAYGVIQTAEFGAAAVAGLMSSVPPQQGITNIELNGFDDLPMVYSTFNRQELNDMAEDGTMIIMQDIAGGRVYIRHQVSTAAAAGNINTTELSITKNLDSISYYFANRLERFIGRYNITPDLLEVLRTQINDGLNYLGSYTDLSLLGPQVVPQGTSIVRLEVHPSLEDHVLATVNLNLPKPLNVLELRLVV